VEFISKSPDDLSETVNYLVKRIKKPALILLSGNLGYGKTTLVKKLFAAFGLNESTVKSPTYSLINSYELDQLSLNHLDLYRLDKPDDFILQEIWELLSQKNSITAIEWAEKINLQFPADQDINVIKIKLEKDTNNFRKISIYDNN
jgi:tRNA threonylcarbamoyladenosine biosynthesis protein TsaE